MERTRLALLALAVVASGCGSHGGAPQNPLDSLSPQVRQRLLAQLDRETASQVKRATHGRIDPKRYLREEWCTRKNDSQVVCNVKGLGKYRYEWRWEVTVDRQTDRYRIRVVGNHLPPGFE